MFRAKKALEPDHENSVLNTPPLAARFLSYQSGPGSHRMTAGNPGEVLSTGAGTVFPKPSQLLLVLKNKSMASTRRDNIQVLKT